MIPVRFWFVTAFLCLVCTGLFGQYPEHVPGQLLVQLNKTSDPAALAARLAADLPRTKPGRTSLVARSLNIWLLEIAEGETTERPALDWLYRQPEVLAAQYNRILEYRAKPAGILPDDPLYPQQWHHRNTGAAGGLAGADHSAEEAWNITTGGLTPQGDTIVIAVIDGGIEHTHEDLTANMWVNRHEIPYDGLDNDANGYTDDCKGWSIFTNNDQITGVSTTHGTPVAALIGAKGNNGTGVAGVNWNTKIMFIAGNSQESVILAAYDYVLQSRKSYNATNGQNGAFVVAVNCSWGITGGQPASAPLWCAAFDSLGAAGILSVAATANTPLDVDIAGDLPTACPSDYLIAVTSLTNSDQKAENAAWGATMIDLGAYGKDVFTARSGNSYGLVTGTSFAAPQVSGAIGLLYAAPCNNLIERAKANPAAAALWVKDRLLETTVPVAALNAITLTGGRLDLYNLLQEYEDQCTDCIPPFALRAENTSANTMQVQWSAVSNVQSVSLRWRKKGDVTWNLVPGATSPFLLSGLLPCTGYEISLRAGCTGNLSSSWTDPEMFTTDGCCSPPAGIVVADTDANSANLSWSGPLTAKGYRVSIQAPNDAPLVYQPTQNNLVLTGLKPCTNYIVEIRSLCDPDTLSAPAVLQFTTGGCGACTDLTYCAAAAGSAKDEWIADVEIGSWSHTPGGGTGYKNFTSSATVPTLELVPGVVLPVTLSPGFSGLPYKEHFRVYIDYNADGDFGDPDELAFDPGFSSDMPISGQITPPAGMAWGTTRMRILMKYKGPQGAPPMPCETFEFGQVADYCVQLGPAVFSSQRRETERSLQVQPQPANHRAWIQLPGNCTKLSHFFVADPVGKIVHSQTIQPAQSALMLDVSRFAQGLYLLFLQTETETWRQKLLIARP